MKHVSKALLLALVLALTVGVFAACNRTNGLTRESEAIGTPETVSRNKEPYSATLFPYESVEEALRGDFKSSPYYKSLNGEWDFTLVLNPNLVPEGYETEKYAYSVSEFAPVRMKEEDSVAWGKISVPSNWELEGYDAPSYTYNTYTWGDEIVAPAISDSYNPVGIYRNTIEVPSDWSDRQVYVNFDGVASCVYVYVNGAMVGYAEDSYTGKSFNITEAVKFGKENLVVFEVYKYCDGSYLEANDSIKFGGIYRDVYLYAAPETQIRDFTYDMQMSGEDALMNVTVALASYSEPAKGMTVDLSVYDASGNCVLQPTQVGVPANFSTKPASTANAYLGEVGGRVSVPSPKLWSAETPNLYTVVLQLKDGDKVVDTVSKRIGFKTVGVTVDDNGRQTFVLNDRVVVLRGVLYNELSAVTGMTLTKEEMVADIKLMKELNINAVRSPGRPLSADFISLCDEYGLYVIDDMSLNSNPYSSKDELSIPGDQSVWQNACLDRLLNVVYRDKNSASVIMWAIGNDSGTGSNFSVLRRWLTSADNRLIVYDDDETASDILFTSDLALNDFVQLLNKTDNKKAILVQNTRGGLLNNGGSFNSYAELMDSYSNFQGGFFSYWTDNAIYWPKDKDNAAETLQQIPYNAENASAYTLTYAGGWGEDTSASKTYFALSGIVGADRKLQSDALELKNALSPIYIAAQNAAAGTFKVTNRNAFTDYSGNYEISYEITDGKTVLSNGTVAGLDVKAGQSATFSLDLVEGARYICFTVKYTNAPVWSENADLTVFERQYSLTEDTSVPKDGSVQTHSGSDLSVEIFQAPEVYISSYTFSKGQFYVTNRSQTNFNDVFTVSWVVYEQHGYWAVKRWVVYDQGTLGNFNVPAGAVNQLVTLPINTTGAASGAAYSAQLVLTSKVDLAGVPAGTQFVYTVNPDGASDNIPFQTDSRRNPVEISVDEEGYATFGPAPMDAEPEVNEETDLYEVPEAPASYAGSSIIEIKNGTVSLMINAGNGLITKYAVNGKDIFVNADGDSSSMVSNLMRNPTGGDIISSALPTSVMNSLKTLSQDNASTKTLPNGYKITQVSAQQVRIELEYLWVTYPVSAMRAFSYDTHYTVVYDLFSDGEIQVSVKYDPTVGSALPMELSSIMTLTSDFKTMSWHGMGPGESYSDKPANNRTNVYKDVAIADQIGSDYLYSTGSGDKTDLRWVALERDDGTGIVITSDTDFFGVNVSKNYPWQTSAYVATGSSVANKNTVLRVIGQQRGVGANTLFDQEYSDASYLIPGMNYTYSFRIVPVEKNYDAEKISLSVLNSGTELSADDVISLDNNSFALINAAQNSSYLSVGADGSVSVSAALGNASQIWIKEAATDLDVADAFRLKSGLNGLYLSPVSRDSYGILATEAELTLAPYKNLAWQNWIYQDNQLFLPKYSGSGYYALYIGGSSNFSAAGARLALKAARSENQSKWTVIADENDPNRILVQSAASGKYLTVVNSLTYNDPLVADYAYRARNYSTRIKWNDAASISRALPYTAADAEEWVGCEYYVTQWDLLPAESQMWTFVPVDGGYLIVNKQNGNALTIANGALTQTAVTEGEDQIWSVISCNGMYGIVNASSNMALTLRSVNGSVVLTAQAWDGLGIQLWSLASEDQLKVDVQAGSNWYN